MAYRKKTLRSMSPVTRKVARLIGEQESIAKRFKNLIPEIQRLELDSQALTTAKQFPRLTGPEAGGDLPDILSYENTGIDRDHRRFDW